MTTLSSISKFTTAIGRTATAVLLAGVVSWTAMHAAALGDPGLPPGKDSSGDGSVGTLPMTGGTSGEFDQTIALRGDIGMIRASILDAGGDGSVQVIPMANGEAWVRFYGDVRLELDLSALATVDVSVFSGYFGGGMAFAVSTPGGMGSVTGIEAGSEIPLDVVWFANAGLLDEGLSVHGMHSIGLRTSTTLTHDAGAGTLILQQDV